MLLPLLLSKLESKGGISDSPRASISEPQAIPPSLLNVYQVHHLYSRKGKKGSQTSTVLQARESEAVTGEATEERDCGSRGLYNSRAKRLSK